MLFRGVRDSIVLIENWDTSVTGMFQLQARPFAILPPVHHDDGITTFEEVEIEPIPLSICQRSNRQRAHDLSRGLPACLIVVVCVFFLPFLERYNPIGILRCYQGDVFLDLLEVNTTLRFDNEV